MQWLKGDQNIVKFALQSSWDTSKICRIWQFINLSSHTFKILRPLYGTVTTPVLTTCHIYPQGIARAIWPQVRCFAASGYSRFCWGGRAGLTDVLWCGNGATNWCGTDRDNVKVILLGKAVRRAWAVQLLRHTRPATTRVWLRIGAGDCDVRHDAGNWQPRAHPYQDGGRFGNVYRRNPSSLCLR